MKTPTPKILENLEYLVLTCELCQKIRSAPKHYHVTKRAENTRFYVKVYTEFTYSESDPMLHMADDAMYLSTS